MKLSFLSAVAFAALAHGHCIFQKVSVNGKEYGSLAGLRAPNQNNPTTDVNSQDMICGKVATSSQEVISVAPGDKIGAWWQHVIGGAQFPGDPDNPIAASHKGPITAWLAKVPSASSTGITGLNWFKVAEDNLDTSSGKWAVDKMISNNGWSYFNLPQCIAPGEYLLRVELLALHSAHTQNGAQFYISCANIKVTGSGSLSPSSTVKFPGAYQQSDPSIFINIYGTGGVPNNGGKAYTAPGPRPVTC
ncbi:Endoglucanase-4 [Colletotrichum gloeosporioides]|uniref:lytic cellulose monooxygenase (C4-dehydrogenating) n=1 Tax=Colletotrichum gloeosporioides TaxID=474922 RepID=A0A8H4CAM6_COLGL|nr:Endoglucanase-4 [Colletotrichum gloeosporioides]KAF3800410.1 Endoglucanase-4 [Colletotrichum gloeosporioides]